jgi:hypothetical protein
MHLRLGSHKKGEAGRRERVDVDYGILWNSGVLLGVLKEKGIGEEVGHDPAGGGICCYEGRGDLEAKSS